MSMDREIGTRSDRGPAADGPGQLGMDRGTAEKAKGKVEELASEARHSATDQLENRKSRTADTLSGVARSLRSSGEQLQGDQNDAAPYVRQAADQVERFAGYLQNRDVGQMIDQAEDLARRQPAMFVGGAFALGLIGARFLKSSRDRIEGEGMRRDRQPRNLPESMSDFERGPFDRPQTGYVPPAGMPPSPEPTPPRQPNIPDDNRPSPEIGVGYAAGRAGERRDEPGETEGPDRRPS